MHTYRVLYGYFNASGVVEVCADDCDGAMLAAANEVFARGVGRPRYVHWSHVPRSFRVHEVAAITEVTL
jgi:hypothetical protein